MLPEEWTKRLVDENIDELTDEDLAWADMVLYRCNGEFSANRLSTSSTVARTIGIENRCRRPAFYGGTGRF
jgi:hypothetical protein